MTEKRSETERSNRISSAFFGFVDSIREARRLRDEFYRNNPDLRR
ncbi:hypothetical protein [Fulvimarina endophytica]|nr:hypothetical protein [Fulvimarina endophytica]